MCTIYAHIRVCAYSSIHIYTYENFLFNQTKIKKLTKTLSATLIDWFLKKDIENMLINR